MMSRELICFKSKSSTSMEKPRKKSKYPTMENNICFSTCNSNSNLNSMISSNNLNGDKNNKKSIFLRKYFSNDSLSITRYKPKISTLKSEISNLKRNNSVIVLQDNKPLVDESKYNDEDLRKILVRFYQLSKFCISSIISRLLFLV